MSNFDFLRSDIRRACAGARIFAVNKRAMPLPNGAVEGAVDTLAGVGVSTVFFDSADEVEKDGTVVLAFHEEDVRAADRAAFFTAPASAPLEVKMRSSFVSNLDGNDAVVEIAGLIVMAKKLQY